MKNFLLTFLIFLLLAIQMNAQSEGDVIVTEIMQNPSAVTDSNGEWFEILNKTSSAIDIEDWVFSDNGTNSFTISGSLILPANGYLVIGVNTNTATNGGAPVDYDWGSSNFALTNVDDEVIIETDGGVEIDRVEYDGGPNFPDPTGASMSLNVLTGTGNNTGSNWETATAAWIGSAGDFGSPGVENPNALPVTLISFKANIYKQNSINLTWQTASEENNDYFSIEHSTDGTSFREIATQAGNGTTELVQNYSFLHREVANGLHYYRLKQVDFDGKFEYTNIVTAKISHTNDEVILTPNPTSNVILIQTKTPYERDADFQILNMQGQVVLSSVLQAGVTDMELNISDFPVGIYYLQLFVDNDVMMKKIIKQ